MHSMKNGLAVCIAVGVLVALSSAQKTIEDLTGKYEGPISFPTIMSIDDEGVVSNHCLDEYSDECRAQVPLGIITVTISNASVSFNFSQSIGVTSPDISKKTYPACVEGGLYPLETITPFPPSVFQSFDPTTGHLTFINTRRPDDVNCMIARTKEGPLSKILKGKYLLTIENYSEMEALIKGPSFRCVVYNDLCIAEPTKQGNFISFVDLDYEIPKVPDASTGSEASFGKMSHIKRQY